MTNHETYEVLALRYGERPERTRQENFLELVDAHDSPDYFVWVLRNANRTVVVDTGFDHAEAARVEEMTKRPVSTVRSPEALTASGITPAIQC